MATEKVELIFDPIFGVRAKKKFTKDAEKVGEKAGKKSGAGFSDGFSKAVRGGTKAVLASVAAATAGAFALKGAANAAAEVEQISVRLKTLTGSAEATAVVMKDLKEFAAETPFKLSDIANASSKLIAFGTSAGDVKDVVKEIGEVAAGTGSDMGELALIYGQVGAAGKLTGERLLQLQERSVPIGPALAKSMNVAESSIKDLVSQGKVTVDVFNKAFKSMSSAGGQFEGALKAQSKTVNGILSTLSDNFFNLSVGIGDSLKPAIISSATTLISALQDMSKIVANNAPTMIKFFSTMADVLIITPTKFWTNFFGGEASTSVSRLNGEIVETMVQMRQAKKELTAASASRGPAGFLNSLFGNKEEATAKFNAIQAKLFELQATKRQLVSQEMNEQSVRDQMELDAAERKAQLESARMFKEKEMAKQALGTFGLERDEILRMQAESQISIVTAAHEKEVLSQMDAAQRIAKIRGDLAVKLGDLNKKTADDTKKKSFNAASSVASGISSIAQSMAGALAAGENVISALGSSMLNAIGDIAIQMGEFFIAAGVAKMALELFPGGAGIATGLALVAFGSLMKSLSGGGGSSAPSSSSGGGVGASATASLTGETEGATTAEPEERSTQTGVVLNIAGDFLDSDEGGLKIVNAVNRAFETQGAVIRTNIA